MGEAGLAEMHLGIHHAGQQVQAAAVDHLAGGGTCEIADRRKTVGANADIAQGHAVMVDHGAALEDQVVGFGHSGAFLARA